MTPVFLHCRLEISGETMLWPSRLRQSLKELGGHWHSISTAHVAWFFPPTPRLFCHVPLFTTAFIEINHITFWSHTQNILRLLVKHISCSEDHHQYQQLICLNNHILKLMLKLTAPIQGSLNTIAKFCANCTLHSSSLYQLHVSGPHSLFSPQLRMDNHSFKRLHEESQTLYQSWLQSKCAQSCLSMIELSLFYVPLERTKPKGYIIQ